MNRVTLETNDVFDLQLLLSLAKRLNAKIVDVKSTSTQITDAPLDANELSILLQNSSSFDFLKAQEEDIYIDADLKTKYY